MSNDPDINEKRTLELKEAADRYTELIDRIIPDNKEQGIAVAVMVAAQVANRMVDYAKDKDPSLNEVLDDKLLQYICGQARVIADLGPQYVTAFLLRLSLEISNNFREARVYHQIQESMRNISQGEK